MFDGKSWRSVASYDARVYQIVALGMLLSYGIFWLRFDLQPLQAGAILGAALGTQWLFTRLYRLPDFEPKSALISGLSLCLLLRTNSLPIAIAAAVATISSKFLLRWKGKHLFNPTNFGLVLMLIFSGSPVWVSPGQWGSAALFVFFMICLGGLVVNRASRADITLSFLIFYAAIVFGRSIWLSEPLTIPFHRLQNGALVLFAFFMISDPKTTPNSRLARILFAFLVAVGAGYVQFRLFRTNGLLWSLALCSLTVPLLDWLLPAQRYEWRLKPTVFREPKLRTSKGSIYEPACT